MDDPADSSNQFPLNSSLPCGFQPMLETLLSSLKQPIAVVSCSSGEIVFASQLFFKRFHANVGELPLPFEFFFKTDYQVIQNGLESSSEYSLLLTGASSAGGESRFQATFKKIDSENVLLILDEKEERLKLEKTLNETRERLNQITEHSSLAMAMFSPVSFELRWVNRAFSVMFGYDTEELPGRKVTQLYSGGAEMKVMKYFDEFIGSREQISISCRFQCKRKNGGLFYTSISLSKVELQNESLLLMTCQDISALFDDYQELRKKEAQMRLITETCPDTIFMLDLKGYFVYVSPSSKRTIGLAPEEVTGNHFMERVPEVEQGKVQRLFEYVLAGKKVKLTEVISLNEKGKLTPIEVSAAPLVLDGTLTAIVGVARNIEERKQDRNRLQKANLELESVFLALPDLYFRVSVSDHVVLDVKVGGQYHKMGIPALELVGKKISELLPEQAFRLYLAAVDTMTISNELQSYEYQMPGNRWYETRLLPFTRGQAIALVRDITDRKNGEMQVVEAKRQADEANNAKSDFLSTVSHEMRTPLNGILGTCELLSSLPMDDKEKRWLDIIDKSGSELLRIVTSILEYVRLDSSNALEEMIRLNPSGLIMETITMMKANAGSIDFVVDVPEDMHRIVAEPGAIRKILLILLDNAFKYTNEGEVRITARTEEHGGDSRCLTVRVEDSGCGVEEQMIPYMFTPFSQGEDPYVRRHGGIGMGLAVASKLANLMGGGIQYSRREDGGIVFDFHAIFSAGDSID